MTSNPTAAGAAPASAPDRSDLRNRPVRFAVIGCGALARGTHMPNIVRGDATALEMCCDTSEEALALCREKFGVQRTSRDWREAIDDPAVDAICLATTERLRLPVIEAAARAGKPIYVEKPLARTLEEVYAIQKVVNEHGIPFCIGHNRRSSPAMQFARRTFRDHMTDPKPCPWRWSRDEGRPNLPEDGTPSMSVRVNDDWYSWKGWVFDKEQAPHGPMLFEMTHFTDMCNWFLAAEPTEVTAVETGMLNHAIIVRYADGALATITMCANGTFGYPKELYEIMGGGAIVVVDHMVEVRTAGIVDAPVRKPFNAPRDRYPDIGTQGGIAGYLEKQQQACRDAAESDDKSKVMFGGVDKGHGLQLDHFVEEIRGQREPVCPVDDAVLATRVAFAAIRSAHERRTIELSDI